MQGCSTTGAIRAERIDIINQHDSVDDTIKQNIQTIDVYMQW